MASFDFEFCLDLPRSFETAEGAVKAYFVTCISRPLLLRRSRGSSLMRHDSEAAFTNDASWLSLVEKQGDIEMPQEVGFVKT